MDFLLCFSMPIVYTYVNTFYSNIGILNFIACNEPVEKVLLRGYDVLAKSDFSRLSFNQAGYRPGKALLPFLLSMKLSDGAAAMRHLVFSKMECYFNVYFLRVAHIASMSSGRRDEKSIS